MCVRDVLCVMCDVCEYVVAVEARLLDQELANDINLALALNKSHRLMHTHITTLVLDSSQGKKTETQPKGVKPELGAEGCGRGEILRDPL